MLNKRTKLVLVSVVLLSLITVAVASYIYSNIVTVHVIERSPVYELTLLVNGQATSTDVYIGDMLHFSGILMDTANGVPVGGVEVCITCIVVPVGSVESVPFDVGFATTKADGTFTYEYDEQDIIGDWQFQATILP